MNRGNRDLDEPRVIHYYMVEYAI